MSLMFYLDGGESIKKNKKEKRESKVIWIG